MLGSANINGSKAMHFMTGTLSFQIEHHLFPSMPRPNLQQAQRVVRRYCERRGVPYAETSAWSSYAQVLRHLDAVGAELRARRAAR
jgi:fatty acid desaturase